jgi:hypothetical protein
MKTLKELVEENEGSSTCEDYGYESCVKPSSLRAAAVEWAKETIEEIDNQGNPEVNTTAWCTKQMMKHQLYFIKHFFNLSESDIQ